ncbi:16S rRNA (guanine(527)-N(7))-methyltransferase RsmG [Chondromyces apiculatus]|uniref:Ribosomal RNA small subunit methyltransferase G n=1 Tax=Chondromyces apiculatus DSM 436 TaxID=1192034 RepID=A0A017TC49_9BACT|nr:RsmG family class I SAM-dependent methyltransferase [Chondromyces apiculatus]EYF06863.1 Hypothetical protein CAP_1560 [Chondromyces apiculatus DSM 436]
MSLPSVSSALEERVARALSIGTGLPAPEGEAATAGNEAAASSLVRWIDLIASWNARIDLTAARTDDELVDLMVADALVIAAHVPRGARVVDVGTGAGAPGLALALLRPDLALTLVEPLQKRVSFLRNTIGALLQSEALGAGGRARAPFVERGRGEELARRRPAFDVAVSRATLAPARWLEMGAALTAGAAAPEVWVLLAKEEPPVLPGWEVEADLRYRWPLTSAERRAVRYLRQAPGSTASPPTVPEVT